MSTKKRLVTGFLIILFGVFFILCSDQNNELHARPPYLKHFAENYKAELNGKKITCKNCHPAGTGFGLATKRNEYAKQLKKEFKDKKNVKDKETIVKAFKSLEKKDSTVKDKKWLDLIKAGTWPEAPEMEEDKNDKKKEDK